MSRVREVLLQSKYDGIVLIGGLDVVPSERLNVLDDALRRSVDEMIERSGGRGDSDNFIIWNDDGYGDRDGDHLPELPVSRIPDGRKSELLFAQLCASGVKAETTTGVRNLDRPFAEAVFQSSANAPGRLFVSEPTTPSDLSQGSLRGSLYFMLHGRDTDSTRYWGEDEFGDAVAAVDLSNVPAEMSGAVVLVGCCWGALTALPRASKYQHPEALQPKTDADSMALAFLSRGAAAVIGCTGTHYSPGEEPYNYFGKPMHMSFWEAIRGGAAPSLALFNAKRKYATNLPHGQSDPFSRAVEMKICRQFACLGLGW